MSKSWETEHTDLRCALDANPPSPALSADIDHVIAFINGENDERNWHWIVRLENGRVAYLTGGCDYTGWDCQSNLDVFEEDSVDSALRQVNESERDELRRQAIAFVFRGDPA